LCTYLPPCSHPCSHPCAGTLLLPDTVVLPDTGPGSDFSLNVASTCFQQPCSLARLGSRSAGSGCPCACTQYVNPMLLVSFSLIGGEEVRASQCGGSVNNFQAYPNTRLPDCARSYGLWCIALSLPLRCKHCSIVMEGPGTG
jgi:hypothetical protein